MNKRIQELAEQCTDQYRDGRGGYIDHVDIEKFAELIVKEVLAVQEKLIADGHNAWHLHSPTKEHFGVE
jgi:hypothetical protein